MELIPSLVVSQFEKSCQPCHPCHPEFIEGCRRMPKMSACPDSYRDCRRRVYRSCQSEFTEGGIVEGGFAEGKQKPAIVIFSCC